MEVQKFKVRLPSGKEVGLLDALLFCYDISDTDFKVLKELIKKGPKNEDELAAELKLSKASVNRSLNKLLSIGFVQRMKDQSSKGGRPRFIYSAISSDEIVNKITRDFEYCAKIFISITPAELK
jgi:predicted transcriptional regulator